MAIGLLIACSTTSDCRTIHSCRTRGTGPGWLCPAGCVSTAVTALLEPRIQVMNVPISCHQDGRSRKCDSPERCTNEVGNGQHHQTQQQHCKSELGAPRIHKQGGGIQISLERWRVPNTSSEDRQECHICRRARHEGGQDGPLGKVQEGQVHGLSDDDVCGVPDEQGHAPYVGSKELVEQQWRWIGLGHPREVAHDGCDREDHHIVGCQYRQSTSQDEVSRKHFVTAGTCTAGDMCRDVCKHPRVIQ
mmetsp:Transcript_4954/g.14259  ORF Transcript_4954/g.14259 Transcript_4954/m.14259 type:complete len:247 (+) Transcript_4954:1715-2455(+)